MEFKTELYLKLGYKSKRHTELLVKPIKLQHIKIHFCDLNICCECLNTYIMIKRFFVSMDPLSGHNVKVLINIKYI